MSLRLSISKAYTIPLQMQSHGLSMTPDGLISWTVLIDTLYLSTIGGSTWIITLQLCRQKTLYLIYPSISYIGIVIYISASTNTTHPTNIITMVSHLPLQRHGFSESAHPTPGSLFGRGRMRLQ
jgi:hypothetical protein